MANPHHAIAGIERLERLAMGDSPVHRLHPMAKLIPCIVYIVTVVSFPSQNVSGLIPFLLYPVFLMSISGTPYRTIMRRLAAAMPFPLLGGISALLFAKGTAFTIGTLAIRYGMITFASIMLKALLTVSAVLLLIATTPFAEITRGFAALRVPKLLCLQLGMTYRYLSVLLEEATTMLTAYTLRARDQKGIRMRDIGSFLGQLILRSFDRAERVYQAMMCRGFEGVYGGKRHRAVRASDWLYAALSPLAMLALRFFNASLFLGNLIR